MNHRVDVCPTGGEAHGPLVGLTGNPHWGFHCPNQDHDGRPQTHPAGPAPSTRSFFTTAEVVAAAAAAKAKPEPEAAVAT